MTKHPATSQGPPPPSPPLTCNLRTPMAKEAIMIPKQSLPALTLLLAQVGMASATTVQHCTGEQGEPSYTFSSCANGEAGRPLRAWNPPPGSVTPAPTPSPEAMADNPPAKQPAHEPTLASGPMPRRSEARQAIGPTRETKSREPTQKKARKKPARYVPWR